MHSHQTTLQTPPAQPDVQTDGPGEISNAIRKSTESSAAKPTLRAAIEFKCHECLGGYADGLDDCENPRCPIYLAMPYARCDADLWWTEFSPRRPGYQRPKLISAEQREQARKNLLAARAAKKGNP